MLHNKFEIKKQNWKTKSYFYLKILKRKYKKEIQMQTGELLENNDNENISEPTVNRSNRAQRKIDSF